MRRRSMCERCAGALCSTHPHRMPWDSAQMSLQRTRLHRSTPTSKMTPELPKRLSSFLFAPGSSARRGTRHAAGATQ